MISIPANRNNMRGVWSKYVHEECFPQYSLVLIQHTTNYRGFCIYLWTLWNRINLQSG